MNLSKDQQGRILDLTKTEFHTLSSEETFNQRQELMDKIKFIQVIGHIMEKNIGGVVCYQSKRDINASKTVFRGETPDNHYYTFDGCYGISSNEGTVFIENEVTRDVFNAEIFTITKPLLAVTNMWNNLLIYIKKDGQIVKGTVTFMTMIFPPALRNSITRQDYIFPDFCYIGGLLTKKFSAGSDYVQTRLNEI